VLVAERDAERRKLFECKTEMEAKNDALKTELEKERGEKERLYRENQRLKLRIQDI